MRTLLLLASLTIAFGCADPNWKHFHDNQFPAFVDNVTFPGNATLSATSSVSFGSWTVSFDAASPPVMAGYNGNMIYMISGLTAHNAVNGDFPCILYYMDGATLGARRRGDHSYQWDLGVLTQAWDARTQVSAGTFPSYAANGIISIPFPTAIQLKP